MYNTTSEFHSHGPSPTPPSWKVGPLICCHSMQDPTPMDQTLYKPLNSGAKRGPVGRKSRSIPRTCVCSCLNESLFSSVQTGSNVVKLLPNGLLVSKCIIWRLSQLKILYRGSTKYIFSNYTFRDQEDDHQMDLQMQFTHYEPDLAYPLWQGLP